MLFASLSLKQSDIVDNSAKIFLETIGDYF